MGFEPFATPASPAASPAPAGGPAPTPAPAPAPAPASGERTLSSLVTGEGATPEPRPARTGELPILGPAIRDVEAKQSFGPMTNFITALAPETYPELAAMVGLTFFGGPLAGAAGKFLPRVGPAIGRVASAAIPAGVAGMFTGEGALSPAAWAGGAQAGIEGALPLVRSLPGVSHLLERGAARIDVKKLVNEIGSLIPEWRPLLRGKKDAQAIFDMLISPEGERAMTAAYQRAKDVAFAGTRRVESPALQMYDDLLRDKFKDPARRVAQAGEALAQAGRMGTGPTAYTTRLMDRPYARKIFEDLERDITIAEGMVGKNPHVQNFLDLAQRARTELAQQLGAPDLVGAYNRTQLSRSMTEFFRNSNAITPGPRYNAKAAMEHAATPEGLKSLTGLDPVTNVVNRGRPGYAPAEPHKVGLPVWVGGGGSGARVTLGVPISFEHAGYNPGLVGRGVEAIFGQQMPIELLKDK